MKKAAFFFTVGGVCYPLLEILWRGHTHWSMALAGGVCFWLFSFVDDAFRSRSLVFKAFLCALGVTAVELLFGLIFNLLLGMNVWDYSDRLFHLWGQICPLFSLLWWGLGLLLLPLVEKLNRFFDRLETRRSV